MKTKKYWLLGGMALLVAIVAAAVFLLSAKPGQETLKHGHSDGEITGELPQAAEMYRMQKDGTPLPRDFVQQPPLIPHTIRDYQITRNFNKCMDCHSFSRAAQTGAPKVSVTHFKTRDGEELSNISPRRYFCTQCHVPQTDATPLVENTFKPATGIR